MSETHLRTGSGSFGSRGITRLLVGILVLTFSGQGFAQKYKQLPKPDASKIRELNSQVRSMVDGRAAMDQTLMVDWYGRVVFASMTQPSQFDNLPKWRGIFVKDLQKCAQRNPALHAPLRDFALKIATTMIKSGQDPTQEYHPVVRYNAMLLIGDLNQQEPVTVGANQTPPQPLPKALDIMLTEFDNPDQIDAVRLPCLVGILRHAELTRVGMEIPEVSRQKITASCLALLAAAQPPAGRSRDGHVWMQRRAMEILGALGSPGPSGEVARALDQIVRDEKGASLRMRCTAADALGRLEFPSDPGLDIDKTARGLGTITISVCRTHIDRLQERLRERDMGGGGYGASGGYGYGGAGPRPPAATSGYPYGRGAGATSRDGGSGGRPSSGYQATRSGRGRESGSEYGYGSSGYGAASGLEEEPIPEDPLLTEARRALKHHLGCVKNGLSGTEKVAPQHEGVKELKQIVDDLLASLDKEELDAAHLLEAVDERASQLETAFGIPGPESKSPGGRPGPPGPPSNVPA